MIQTLIGCILPIVFTVCFGYFAGTTKAFKEGTPAIVNKIVMSFALPLSLFFTLNQMSRQMIFANWKVVFYLAVFMMLWWLIVYAVSRHFTHASVALSAIRALSISTPAILFVGPALITSLYPKNAAISISLGGLVMNALMLPLTFVVLASTEDDGSGKGVAAKAGKAILNGLKKPVVYSALLGLITALLGLNLPPILEATFTELGKTAAGLGLFSIGMILFFTKPSFSKAVWVNVLCKNILVPLSVFTILVMLKESTDLTNQITLMMAISELIFPTILAQQYKTGEREMSSSMFLSTIISFFVLAAIIILRGITM